MKMIYLNLFDFLPIGFQYYWLKWSPSYSICYWKKNRAEQKQLAIGVILKDRQQNNRWIQKYI